MKRHNYGMPVRTFTAPGSLWARVKLAAKVEGCTVAEYVRRALHYYLDRQQD